jgi:putative transposase
VVKIHSKIANQRKDFAHKQSRKLIDKYDAICFENLTITSMVKNSKLAKSILDASWGMFFHMLQYKAEEAGKLVINIDPKGTSQECSGCHKKVVKDLSMRWHKCPFCGLILHRDFNSALNILARGISYLLAAGLAVTAPGGLMLVKPMKGESSESSIERLPSSFVTVAV